MSFGKMATWYWVSVKCTRKRCPCCQNAHGRFFGRNCVATMGQFQKKKGTILCFGRRKGEAISLKKKIVGILAVGTTISWVFYRGPMSLENFTETHWFHTKNSKNLAQGQLPEDWLVRALATRHSGALFAICLPGTFSWIIPRDSRWRGFIAWSPC